MTAIMILADLVHRIDHALPDEHGFKLVILHSLGHEDRLHRSNAGIGQLSLDALHHLHYHCIVCCKLSCQCQRDVVGVESVSHEVSDHGFLEGVQAGTWSEIIRCLMVHKEVELVVCQNQSFQALMKKSESILQNWSLETSFHVVMSSLDTSTLSEGTSLGMGKSFHLGAYAMMGKLMVR